MKPEERDPVATEATRSLGDELAAVAGEVAAFRQELTELRQLLRELVETLRAGRALEAGGRPAAVLLAGRKGERLNSEVLRRAGLGIDPGDDTGTDLLIDRLHELAESQE